MLNVLFDVFIYGSCRLQINICFSLFVSLVSMVFFKFENGFIQVCNVAIFFSNVAYIVNEIVSCHRYCFFSDSRNVWLLGSFPKNNRSEIFLQINNLEYLETLKYKLCTIVVRICGRMDLLERRQQPFSQFKFLSYKMVLQHIYSGAS